NSLIFILEGKPCLFLCGVWQQMSNYNWMIPILAISSGFGLSGHRSQAVRMVATADSAHETMGQPDAREALLRISAYKGTLAKHEFVKPTHFHATSFASYSMDDHFIALLPHQLD